MKPKARASAPRKRKDSKTTPVVTRQTGRMRPWIGHILRCAALFLMVLVVYSNSFQSGWVVDNRYVIQLDPRNKEASTENLKLIWTKDYWWPRSDSGGYRPIVSTSYLLNWSVFGSGRYPEESDQVVGFHWVNLAAHAINSVIVYFLMLKLLRRDWSAFFAAALFAVHPIATESVTNIVGRADEFAAMGFLGSTWLYIRSTEVTGVRRLPWLLGVVLAFAAGCFSKESALAFMAIPLLFDSVYRWGSESYNRRRARRILIDCLAYILVVVPFLVLYFVRSVIFRDSPVPAEIFVDNPILRFAWNSSSCLSTNVNDWILGRMTACNVAMKSLWKLIWPANLSADYSYNEIKLFTWQLSNVENIKAILSALLIAGTLALAVWCYKRNKAVCFFIFFYWIAYGPTSNFLAIGRSIMAERFLYVPLFGFCGLVVLGVEALSGKAGTTLEFDRDSIKRPWPRLVPPAVFLLILILYGIRTYVRNFDWRSDRTLAESMVRVSPGSFRGYQTLAFMDYETAPTVTIDRILELGETALRILDPLPPEDNTSRMYLHMGMYYGMKGESTARRNADGSFVMNDSLRAWYRKAAQVLERGSEIDLAANAAYRARERMRGKTDIPDVGLSALYMYLGISYRGLGMNEKALDAFRYTRHLDPHEPMAYTQLASAQLALGETEDAAVSLLQCLIVDGQNAEAWQTLMEIYSRINHEGTPAVEVIDGRPRLRDDNKMVRQHLLRAYGEFMKVAESSKLPELSRDARDAALNRYHLEPKLLDVSPDEKGSNPLPPSPVFHTLGKTLDEESALAPSR